MGSALPSAVPLLYVLGSHRRPFLRGEGGPGGKQVQGKAASVPVPGDILVVLTKQTCPRRPPASPESTAWGCGAPWAVPSCVSTVHMRTALQQEVRGRWCVHNLRQLPLGVSRLCLSNNLQSLGKLCIQKQSQAQKEVSIMTEPQGAC